MSLFTMMPASHRRLRKQTILGVSLIHGRLRALAVVKDRVVGSWESQATLETCDQLAEALHEAITATKFPGRRVSFLVHDANFVHQYLQVPAMKPADLRQFIKHEVDINRPWAGDAAWRFRTTLEFNGKVGVLLDICPQDMINRLVEVCTRMGLMPVHIAPLSSTFVEQIRSLPTEEDAVVLLVTLWAEQIVIVIAKGDGTPLFERSLSPTQDGVDPAERIGREIARSMLFCAQQYRVEVSQIWMVGGMGEMTPERLQPFVGATILESPVNPDPLYWIWVCLSLPHNSPSNFVSRKVQWASLRKTLRTVSTAAAAACLVASVAVAAFLQGRLSGESARAEVLTGRNRALLEEKAYWTTRVEEGAAEQAWAKQIVEAGTSVMAGRLLEYLGNVLPPELVLTKAEIVREDHQWRMELHGVAPNDLVQGSRTLARLETMLEQSPWKMTVVDDWRKQWVQQASIARQTSVRNSTRPFSMFARIPG